MKETTEKLISVQVELFNLLINYAIHVDSCVIDRMSFNSRLGANNEPKDNCTCEGKVFALFRKILQKAIPFS